MKKYDVIIVGAGASGLFCAQLVAKNGKSVLLLEHNKSAGRKILISGGGRCNFSNLTVTKDHFTSDKENFVKKALRQYGVEDFLKLVDKYGIEYFEKKDGQLFCKKNAREILNLLLEECRRASVQILYDQKINKIEKNDLFSVETIDNSFFAGTVVMATGGLSIPSIGASDFGYKIAEQFGHKIKKLSAALVPLTAPQFSTLSGISLPVEIKIKKKIIREDLLFTHKGLSGPAILNASLYWGPGEHFLINWIPGIDLNELIQDNLQKQLGSVLKIIPSRFVLFWAEEKKWDLTKKVGHLSLREIEKLKQDLCFYSVLPTGTQGYRKAEVTRGGVDTKELVSQSLESRIVDGLYFIGEVVDVTGRLGGYNFQWAWSSAWSASVHICAQKSRQDNINS